MSSNIQYEARLLVMSFLTGSGLMLSYDFFRVFRILVPHHPIWMGVEDMIYWVYASLITFSLLYSQNDGELRGYVIAGVFIGMILYNNLISRFLLKALKNLVEYLRIKLIGFFAGRR